MTPAHLNYSLHFSTPQTTIFQEKGRGPRRVWRHATRQQRAAIERHREARDDAVGLRVGAPREGARAAREYVAGRGRDAVDDELLVLHLCL